VVIMAKLDMKQVNQLRQMWGSADRDRLTYAMLYSLSLDKEQLWEFKDYMLQEMSTIFRGQVLETANPAIFRLLSTNKEAADMFRFIFFECLRDSGYGYKTRGSRDNCIKQLFLRLGKEAPTFIEPLMDLVSKEPKLSKEIKKFVFEMKLS
jgi:hypothetical protein